MNLWLNLSSFASTPNTIISSLESPEMFLLIISNRKWREMSIMSDYVCQIIFNYISKYDSLYCEKYSHLNCQRFDYHLCDDFYFIRINLPFDSSPWESLLNIN